MPHSKYKEEILKILVKEGYLAKATVKNQPKKQLIVALKYQGKKPVIDEIKMISKPGLRVYKKVNEGRRVLGGLGKRIVSTSLGVMTDDEAKKKKLGGEVILEVS